MNFLWTILFGGVLGILSGLLAKRRDPGSIIVRALIGVFAGAIAGAAATMITPATNASLWVSFVGVFVLLFIYWLIVDKKKTT